MVNLRGLVVLFGMFFFISCSSKQVDIATDIKEIKKEKISKKIEQKVEKKEVKIVPKVKEVTLNPNKKEFLGILKNDKYASLCKEKDFYKRILQTKEISLQDKLLEELLLKYVDNLANSCIDIKDMNKKIAINQAKKIKNSYKVYRQKIDKENILSLYRSMDLKIDAIFTPYTPKHPLFFKFISHLNDKSISKKELKKLRLNIERLKLMKHFKTDNFIQLNIPSYSFHFYENNTTSMNFGTVVGALEDQTPVFSSSLSYFIMNPTWNIPDSIAKKSIIPRMLKNKNYLSKKGIVIHKNYSLDSKKYKQSDIEWRQYLKKNVRYIPYKFIQLPSSTNGMGRVKFIFPNEYAVYMHDTIGTWRFKSSKKSIRAVSHGCVRLEHPKALIKHITKHYTKHTHTSVKKDYDSHRLKTVSLSKKLPLHVTYITAYFDKNDKLKFHNDLYGYDSLQKIK